MEDCPAPPVAELREEDWGQALTTLTEAFLPDPMTPYLFGISRSVERKLGWIFATELRYARRRGVVETLAKGRAVAIWVPPEKANGAALDLIRSGVWKAPFGIGLAPTWRVVQLLRGMHALHGKLQPMTHWYLLALAVHPEAQGQGWGSALLRHGLERAKAAGVPCYLETSRRANVGYYESYGFRLTGQRDISSPALSLWGMIAKP